VTSSTAKNAVFSALVRLPSLAVDDYVFLDDHLDRSGNLKLADVGITFPGS
jgi:hypothetical protein